MKKFITLSLVSGLLLSFATGCAGNNNPVINDQNKPIDILYDNPIKPGDQTDNEPVEKPRVYTEEETLHIDVTKDIKEQLNSKPQAKCIIIDNGTGTELPWDNETRGIVSFRRSIFYSYKNIEKIVLPESFEVIEIDAFSGCSSLREIVIPNSVKKIRSAAFHDCTLLKDIYIPASVTEIEDSVFRGCTSLESIWVDKENQYYSSDEHGVLFDKDKSVLIRCPQSIGLSSYTIPEGVTEIANGAFDEGVTLSEINISDDVVYLNGAFSGCVSLEVITVDKNNLNYSSDENGILFDKNKTKLIRCPENIKLLSYSIPDCVKEIEEYAFSECRYLSEIVVPDSMSEIGNSAFAYLGSLTEVTIPEGVTRISDGAFFSCTSLEKVNMPSSLKEIGECAFTGCSALSEIEIPDGVTEIMNYAFEGCSSIKSIEIPKNMTQINEGAFLLCTSLTSIYIPDNIVTIADSAFSKCNAFTEITIHDKLKIDECAFEYCDSLKKVIVYSGKSAVEPELENGENMAPMFVEQIAENAFHGVGTFEIVISDDITDEKVFSRFGAHANKVTVDKNNPLYSSDKHGVVFNKDKTVLLYFPQGLASEYTIPNSVKTIGAHAFDRCELITKIVIPEGVTEIGVYAFYGCTSLAEITVPGSIDEIPLMAFGLCTSLSEINLQPGIKSMKNRVFSGCTALKEIIIPETVAEIGGYAFEGCTSLAEITIPENVTELGSSLFCSCTSLKKAILHDNVQIFKTYPTPNGSRKEIVDYIDKDNLSLLFIDCSALKEVQLGDKVYTVDEDGNVLT